MNAKKVLPIVNFNCYPVYLSIHFEINWINGFFDLYLLSVQKINAEFTSLQPYFVRLRAVAKLKKSKIVLFEQSLIRLKPRVYTIRMTCYALRAGDPFRRTQQLTKLKWLIPSRFSRHLDNYFLTSKIILIDIRVRLMLIFTEKVRPNSPIIYGP